MKQPMMKCRKLPINDATSVQMAAIIPIVVSGDWTLLEKEKRLSFDFLQNTRMNLITELPNSCLFHTCTVGNQA